MKIYKNLWLGIILISLLSCKKDNEEPVKDYLSPVGEAELPGEIILGQSINTTVLHTGYDGCAIYSRTEIIEKDKEVEVIFYAKGRSGQTACTMALIGIETPFTYTPKTKGTYIFKFNQRDKYLTKTLVVK